MFKPEPVAEPVYEADSEEDEVVEDQEDDVSTDESSNSEDESVPTSSSDNDSDNNEEEPDTVTDTTDTDIAASAYHCPDELDNYNNTSDNYCDNMKHFNTESIVHSLMMPALLSPQIEDITN